jgi:uncharacterized iron-regulated membrane protein
MGLKDSSSAGNKVYRFPWSLHTSNAGLPRQMQLFVGILGIPMLFYTGLRSYLSRKVAPAHVAPPARSPACSAKHSITRGSTLLST